MLNLKTFVIASAALTLVSGVSAGGLYPVKRNEEPGRPSCTDFTPFKYAGCFLDTGATRTLLYTGPRNQNQTVQECVAFCKGNDYQYAGLEYGEECFCGASVNNIQTDEAECNKPCTGDKSEVCGGTDRVSIYQDPTFPVVDFTSISDYQSLGCYSEGSNGRSLAWRQYQVDSATMTVEKCLGACKAGGFSFSGIEYGQECYCGVVLGNGTLPVADAKCNSPCKGDATETCGGRSTLNLYVAEDLESSEPCEGGSSSSSSSVPTPTPSASSSSSSSAVVTTSSSITSSSVVPSSSSAATSSSTLPVTSSSSSASISSSSSAAPSSSSVISSSSVVSTSSSAAVSSSSVASSSSVVSTSQSSSSSAPPSTKPTTSTTSCPTPTPTTAKPTTSSAPLTTAKPSTSSVKPTVSLCTSIYTIAPSPPSGPPPPPPAPPCEYKCGKWCSNPIPKFTDKNSCWTAVASCSVQVASCFLNAGFPESMDCFEFSSWCAKISTYCNGYCPGGSCSKEGCNNKYPIPGPATPPAGPPAGPPKPPGGPANPPPTVSTTVYPCSAPPPATTAKPATTSKAAPTTSKAPTTTSCIPVPTQTNICKQPHNPSKGYSSTSPVGSIELPCLTCNNLESDYRSGYPFKLYTSPQSKNCPSYPHGGNSGPTQGCKDACDSQYESCMDTYAQGCRTSRWGDSYDGAAKKCKSQLTDCYAANSNVQPGNRCGSWNSGWY